MSQICKIRPKNFVKILQTKFKRQKNPKDYRASVNDLIWFLENFSYFV